MDVLITAAPIGAVAEMTTSLVRALRGFIIQVVFSVIERTASFARLSLNGTALNAVAPDYTLTGGTA